LIESGINVTAGHTHLPMLDLENDTVLATCFERLETALLKSESSG